MVLDRVEAGLVNPNKRVRYNQRRRCLRQRGCELGRLAGITQGTKEVVDAEGNGIGVQLAENLPRLALHERLRRLRGDVEVVACHQYEVSGLAIGGEPVERTIQT